MEEDQYDEAELSGWHHDPYGVAVAYRVDQHTDSFVTAWLDALAESPANAQRQAIRKALISQIGACMKCHIAERWRPASRTDFLLGYNRAFRHDTHLSALAPEADCGHCHQPVTDEGAPWHGYETYDLAICVSCHRPGGADDRCLTCHTYHLIR